MSGGKIKFSLNFNKITRIPFDKYENNFTFIVNGKRHQTTRLIADLLSPIICDHHYEDETFSEFIINPSSKSTNDEETFERFLHLLSTEEMYVTEEEGKRFNEYFLQLGNIEEYLRNDSKSFQDIGADELIDRLQFIETNTRNSIKDEENILKIEGMIKYVSKHFNELSPDKIKNIEIELLEEIIKRDELKLEDEDSLLRIILSKYEENHSSSILFEYVRFNEISQSLMNEFIEKIEIEDLNKRTFRNICNNIYSNEKKEKHQINRYEEKYQEFLYKGFKEANGIFKHLTEETGGNIKDNGTIEITSNSIYNGCDLKNLVEFKNSEKFSFADNRNSEICFDLKDKQIQITNYSIKSFADNSGGDHLKNWILEVSNNQKEWIKIDEHKDDSQLNKPFVIATFDPNKTNEFYRFIRLKQTGVNCCDQYDTEFSFIEFYGKLKSKKIITKF